MKTNVLLTFVLFLSLLTVKSQNSSSDTWTIGVGATNTLMHGDLTSLNSENNEPFNLGFYIYASKMLSPAFGFELKGQIMNMKGASQDFSNVYPVLYADTFANGLYSETETFGGELNAVINLNGLVANPYARDNRKFNLSAYIGIGYHSYDSKLFDAVTNELLVDFENEPRRDGDAKSIYYTSGLGLRYKLSHRFDLELRQSVNFNNEDHLDAAITQKQTFETFFNTSLGLVFKLNKKGSESIVWQELDGGQKEAITVEEKPELNLNDSDGDGVIDQFDQEPNTPPGALTYGNGVAIDTDRDGIIDLEDECPLKSGSRELNGCPVEKDTDGDGVIDSEDLCPNIVGPVDNRGCPKATNTITEIEKTTIISLAKNIYFTSGKSDLRDSSKRELDKISSIMSKYENVNFIIEGHTDSGGKRDYNLRLSQDRANSVKNYLIRSGVNAANLTAIGYGFSRPKYTNRTSDGRQLNRRVEIKINDGTEEGSSSTSESFIRHQVVKDDTLYSISKRYGVTVEQLKEWNNLIDNNIILGSTLIIKR